jgi:dolichol-phosphate mannosyltransferase
MLQMWCVAPVDCRHLGVPSLRLEEKHVPGLIETDRARVVIVVPTYNEAENLPVLVERLFALKIPGLHLLIIDDGSPDGTGEVAKSLGHELDGRVELLQRGKKMGLGTAYVDGMALALAQSPDYIVQMDADMSHPPERVPAFLEALEDADVVVGSRYVEGGGSEDSWGIRRRALSLMSNEGIRLASGVKVKDATSGFKAFRREAMAAVDLALFRCSGFGFQVEMIKACESRGFKIAELPIMFGHRASGKSKMSLSIAVEALWRLPALRFGRVP